VATIAYRVRLRDTTDSSDALVLTSYRGGENPYLAGPPEGDGQEVDLLASTTSVGSYTVRVVDAEVEGGGRVVTQELADAAAQLHVLSRRAYVEVSTDGGGSWAELIGGYLTRLALASAIEWELTISDTDRLDTVTKVFEFADEEMGGLSCLIGGPVAGLTTSPPPIYSTGMASFGPMGDFGPATFEVVAVDAQVVTLHFTGGYVRPDFAESLSAMTPAAARAINACAAGYFAEDEDTWAAGNIFGWFPDLVVRLESGADVYRVRPLAAATRKVQTGLTYKYIGARDSLVSTDTTASTPFNPTAEQRAGYLYLHWPAAGGTYPDGSAIPAQPSVGATYTVHVYPKAISAEAPQHLLGHPVALVTRLWARYGIPYDAASAASVESTLDTAWGGALVAGLRVTAQSLKDFASKVGALFGFAWRYNAQGERVLFCTRVRPATAQTITLADIRSYDPEVFALEEASVVKGVTVTGRRYDVYDPDLDDAPGAVDALVENESKVDGEREGNAMDAAFSDRSESYDLPGYVTVGGSLVTVPELVTAVGDAVVALRGRGLAVTELACLPTVTAQVGDEVDVALPHLPAAVAGRTPVAQRIDSTDVVVPMRVVRRTETPAGPELKLEWAALADQQAPPPAPPGEVAEVPVPEFTLAADASDTTRNVLVTITNDVELIALGAIVRLEWSVAVPEPAEGVSGDNAEDVSPLVPPTAVLEQATPGATVWVRARTLDPRTVRLPWLGEVIVGLALSDWSAWQSITLDAQVDGTPGGGGGTTYTVPIPFLRATWAGGVPTVTAVLTDPAVTVKLKVAVAQPTAVEVRAESLMASEPFNVEAGFTLAYGETAWAAAYAYDATGNESVMARLPLTRPTPTITREWVPFFHGAPGFSGFQIGTGADLGQAQWRWYDLTGQTAGILETNVVSGGAGTLYVDYWDTDTNAWVGMGPNVRLGDGLDTVADHPTSARRGQNASIVPAAQRLVLMRISQFGAAGAVVGNIDLAIGDEVVPPVEGDNLIENPLLSDCPTPPAGNGLMGEWEVVQQGGGTVTLYTAAAALAAGIPAPPIDVGSGCGIVRMTGGALAVKDSALIQYPPQAPGTTYTLSAYVYCVSGGTQGPTIYAGTANGANPANNPFLNGTEDWMGDGAWHRLSVTFTANTGEVDQTPEVVFKQDGTVEGTPGESWWCGFQYEVGSTATEFTP
jgi:hypothetical protein